MQAALPGSSALWRRRYSCSRYLCGRALTSSVIFVQTGIMKSLTNEEVEKRLLQRVRRKAIFYGQVRHQRRGGSITIDSVENHRRESPRHLFEIGVYNSGFTSPITVLAQDVTETEAREDVLKVSPDRVAEIYEKVCNGLILLVVIYLIHS